MRLPRITSSLLALAITCFCIFQSSPVRADVLGDCLLSEPRGPNPGIGCSSHSLGKACTVLGVAGKCKNVPAIPSSLQACVCMPDGGINAIPEETKGKATAVGPVSRSCGATVTFDVDESAPQVLEIALSEALGNRFLQLESFSGTFTISTTLPDDGDAAQCNLRIEGGAFSAPSFVLPDGRSTGTNTYTFGPSSSSNGFLDLATGEYLVTTTGKISNDLYSDLPTQGRYKGKVDFDAGTVTFDSTTLDFLSLATVKPFELH